MSPQVGRAVLGWVVFIVLLAGALVLAAQPGTPAFVISVVMLGFGVLCGGVLIVLVRLSSR